MDIVYILGTGSQFNDEEIRYSLRSLCNLHHDKVFVIGEKPDFFSDEIHHIPAEDPYSIKQLNALHKLEVACNATGVSKDFILMNDDFFILKPVESLVAYYRRTLGESLTVRPTHSGDFYKAMQRTHDILGGGLDYAHHTPFIYNKTKLKKIIKEVREIGEAIHLRTLYGNRYDIGGEQREDVKIRDKQEFIKLCKGDMISTDDLVFGSYRFQSLIQRTFPDKCKYEK